MGSSGHNPVATYQTRLALENLPDAVDGVHRSEALNCEADLAASRPRKSFVHKKLRTLRRDDFDGPRRAIPRVREHNRALRERLAHEQFLVQGLIRDARMRGAIAAGLSMPIDPLSVYQDFDHSYYPTEVQPHHLPVWEDSTEHLKAQIGFQAGLCFGGYSFTVNVHPHMEEGWTAEGVDYARIIQKRMHAELVRAGLGGLPLFYIIEGRSKSGKSRTKLHIHGYFLTEDPIVSSRMVKVFQRALRREQDGTINEDTNGWDCEPSYDFDDPIWGPGRWVRYSLKNVLRKDDRLTGKRTYMSQSLTQIAREFWLFVRGEPVGKRPQRQQKAPSLEKALRLIEPR